MTLLPARTRPAPVALEAPGRPPRFLPEEESPIHHLMGVLRRGIWWILGCAFAVTLVAGLVLFRMTPVYSAWVTMRVSAKEPNLPEVFRTLATGSDVSTEMGILGSRALVEDAIDSLGLRLELQSPTRVARGTLFSRLHVNQDARNASYRLVAREGGTMLVLSDSGPATTVRIGQPFTLGGLELTLAPAAARYADIQFRILPRPVAASRVGRALQIERPARDADLVSLGYEDVDSQLVRQVPNLVAGRFILRRQETQRTEARSTIKFLNAQIERLSVQLAAAENQFRGFRERQGVIDPVTDASKQVARLIETQSDRGTLDAEREAVEKSLRRVDSLSAATHPGDPSPYRELLAIPSLLKNPAASQLFGALAAADAERAELMMRRTVSDPDVVAVSARVGQIEHQLHEITNTYLQGLKFQLSAMDTTLGQFGRELGSLPRKEVEYGRLARQTKTLEETYTLLQTRLKEAQIAEAIEDPSVQVVDTAVAPLRPAKPRRFLGLVGALVAGTLLGLAAAFLREQTDRSVHSRRDVSMASGLPVVGLIPSMADAQGRVALIAQKREVFIVPAPAPPRPLPPASPQVKRRTYTFLQGDEEPEEAAAPPPGVAPAPAASPGTPARRLRLTVSAVGTPASEAYAILQTNLAFSLGEGVLKTFVLTSALPGDGKTTCAVNLAITLSQRGLRTALIDGDLRRGVIHQALDLGRGPGLSDLLSGSVELPAALRSFEVEGSTAALDFISCGNPTPNPTGLLESENMRTLLAELREGYDRIVIDSPPVNLVTDAAVLSAMADGVLLVARSGVTDAAALVYAVDQLEHVSAPMVGVILNDIDFAKDSAYDGAFRYYNYNEYLTRT
jgi:capsular exopolysaccharide synthesis family protein